MKNEKPEKTIELRRGGPDGELVHTICWYPNGRIELDGVAILAQHVKAKIGGDKVTRELWAKELR